MPPVESRMSTWERIHDLVRRIPPGRVATYGQIARILGSVGPRQVGYAMAGLPEDTDVPWHRVLNHHGQVSPRREPGGDRRQRDRLEAEGIRFGPTGAVDLSTIGWAGPGGDWVGEATS